jgi:hydrogenase/urease accessory protein HupE
MICAIRTLTKGQAYPYEITPSSRQIGYYMGTMTATVQLKRKISGRGSQGA